MNKVGNTSQIKDTLGALPDLQTVFINIDSLDCSESKNTILPSQKARLREQLKQLDIAQKQPAASEYDSLPIAMPLSPYPRLRAFW